MFRSLLIICIISFLGIGCEKKNDGKDPIASLFGSSGAGLLLAAAIQTGSNFNRANCGFSAIDLPEGSYEAHPGTTGSNSSSLSATNRLNHWGFQEFIPPSFGTYTVTSNLLGNLTTVDGDIYLWKNRCPLSESASVGAFNDADGDLGSDEITFDAGPADTVWVGFLKSGVGNYTTTYAYQNSSEICNVPVQGTLTIGNSAGPLISNTIDPVRFYKFVAPSYGAYTFNVDFPDATSEVDIAIAVNRCPTSDGDFYSTWSVSPGVNASRSINRQLTNGDIVYFYYSNAGTNGNAFSLSVNRTNTTFIPQRIDSGFVCPNLNVESLILGETKAKTTICDSSTNDCTRFFRFVAPTTKTYEIDLVAQTGDSDLSVWIGSCPGINIGVNYKNAEAVGDDRISETIQAGTLVTVGVRPQVTNATFSITAN